MDELPQLSTKIFIRFLVNFALMQVISSALMCQTKIQDMSYFSIALSKSLLHNAITIASLCR